MGGEGGGGWGWAEGFKNFSKVAPTINFSLVLHLSLDCRSISRWVVFTEIFKALKSVNTHNNIQTLTFTNNT